MEHVCKICIAYRFGVDAYLVKLLLNAPFKALFRLVDLVRVSAGEGVLYRSAHYGGAYGKQIAATASSAEAFNKVMDYSPDAVILDLELHKGDGDGLKFDKFGKMFCGLRI